MEIIIKVEHRDERIVIDETYKMTTQHFDMLAYPEDVIHAKVWELRNKVTNELISFEKNGNKVVPQPEQDKNNQ